MCFSHGRFPVYSIAVILAYCSLSSTVCVSLQIFLSICFCHFLPLYISFFNSSSLTSRFCFILRLFIFCCTLFLSLFPTLPIIFRVNIDLPNYLSLHLFFWSYILFLFFWISLYCITMYILFPVLSSLHSLFSIQLFPHQFPIHFSTLTHFFFLTLFTSSIPSRPQPSSFPPSSPQPPYLSSFCLFLSLSHKLCFPFSLLSCLFLALLSCFILYSVIGPTSSSPSSLFFPLTLWFPRHHYQQPFHSSQLISIPPLSLHVVSLFSLAHLSSPLSSIFFLSLFLFLFSPNPPYPPLPTFPHSRHQIL